MCDYSLHNVASRPAKVGDKLVTTTFDFLTRGFAAIGEPNVAVCLLPGTEVAFESEVERDHPFGWLLLSAGGEQASAQSTSAENGFVVSNPFPFTETASGNKDHSAFQFKPSMDHHAVTDPEINDITRSSLITRPIPTGLLAPRPSGLSS